MVYYFCVGSILLVENPCCICEMMGMSSKGFLELDLMMELHRIGPGMKMAERSNPTRPSSPGAGMLATYLADLHSARSWTVWTMSWMSLKAVFKSKRTQVAQEPMPSMHTTLFLGWDLVPPKFLGECRIIVLLFKSAAKITVSMSLTNAWSFNLFESTKFMMSLKA